MKIAKNKIRVYFYTGAFLAIIVLAVASYYNITISLRNEYTKKIDQLSTAVIVERQRFLENAVDRTIQMIELERDRAAETHEGASEEQLRQLVVERVREMLHRLRLIDNGYIWINRIVNYDGGEQYAIREIHPNLPDTEGSWLSTETLDINGGKPYRAELDGMNESGELFFEYYFKKMDTDEIAHKMSYARLYEPFDWVVATGVYLDDVDSLIEAEMASMKATYRSQLRFSIITTLAALILAVIMLILFERQIGRLIRTFEADITQYTDSLLIEKRKTEEALKKHQTLLQEIHHRVKNNMYIVSSLLTLQIASLEDDEAKAALQNSQDRIQSMGKIHETLYKSDDLSAVNLKEYISELGENILKNYSANDKARLVLDIDSILLDTKQASPIGLVVNELLTNCLKYAFPESSGEIELSLTSIDETIELIVSDNGVGMPQDFDWRNSGTLGLKLIMTLVEGQLGGSIDLESDDSGTTFTIKFVKL